MASCAVAALSLLVAVTGWRRVRQLRRTQQAIIGDSTGYYIGKKAGAALYNRPQSRLFNRERLLATRAFYDRYGGITIVRDYIHAIRAETKTLRAYVRMEPGPGERCDVDWGHFGALIYNDAPRKLYAFCLVECHSRRMYVEFTHSQSFETFVRCHIHAFEEMGGCSREIWFDNLATAVAEHEGNLVRFNPRFLAFAREYDFIPRACHVAAA